LCASLSSLQYILFSRAQILRPVAQFFRSIFLLIAPSVSKKYLIAKSGVDMQPGASSSGWESFSKMEGLPQKLDWSSNVRSLRARA
jgi:hypothetical protein